MTTPKSTAKQIDVERLGRMMAQWWAGWPLARIGRKHGVCPQRVHQILARVDCIQARRSQARRARADSGGRALPQEVAAARAALTHPLAHRLTPRQRGALAWRAQGLVLVDIARRMGTTAQGVEQFVSAAQWRLVRLDMGRQKRATRSRPHREVDDIGMLELGDAQPSPEEEAGGRVVGEKGP